MPRARSQQAPSRANPGSTVGSKTVRGPAIRSWPRSCCRRTGAGRSGRAAAVAERESRCASRFGPTARGGRVRVPRSWAMRWPNSSARVPDELLNTPRGYRLVARAVLEGHRAVGSRSGARRVNACARCARRARRARSALLSCVNLMGAEPSEPWLRGDLPTSSTRCPSWPNDRARPRRAPTSGRARPRGWPVALEGRARRARRPGVPPATTQLEANAHGLDGRAARPIDDTVTRPFRHVTLPADRNAGAWMRPPASSRERRASFFLRPCGASVGHLRPTGGARASKSTARRARHAGQPFLHTQDLRAGSKPATNRRARRY